jgi:hypothetical protein
MPGASLPVQNQYYQQVWYDDIYIDTSRVGALAEWLTLLE